MIAFHLTMICKKKTTSIETYMCVEINSDNKSLQLPYEDSNIISINKSCCY